MRGDFDEDELDDDDFDDSSDPECSWCGCDLFTEEHDWDCPHYGDDDDEDDEEDDYEDGDFI